MASLVPFLLWNVVSYLIKNLALINTFDHFGNSRINQKIVNIFTAPPNVKYAFVAHVNQVMGDKRLFCVQIFINRGYV